MTGMQALNEHLVDWMKQHNVHPVWKNGWLRLESDDRTAGTVVAFPDRFWDDFDLVSEERQEAALDAIRLNVALQYRPESGSFAHVVRVSSSLLQE